MDAEIVTIIGFFTLFSIIVFFLFADVVIHIDLRKDHNDEPNEEEQE